MQSTLRAEPATGTPTSADGLFVRARRRASGELIRALVHTASSAGKLHPVCRALAREVVFERDVRYAPGAGRFHLLDVVRPREASGALPVLLYVHGGGFRILSKDTHWGFAASFARAGFLVVSINYRLAPRAPFPAALEDAALALAWTLAHAAGRGGDPARLAYAGESAGANLVTALMVAGAWPRPEPHARAVYDADPRPLAVLPACGIHEVSRPERYTRDAALPFWMRDRITAVCRGYLPAGGGDDERVALANPVCFLERAERPERPLPAVLAPCGDADPIAEDTRRLERSLARLGAEVAAPFYAGAGHAFHGLLWAPLAQRCWSDQLAFLDRHVPRGA